MELWKTKRQWPDPRTELDSFKDYHMAHGTLMVDWEAAFRTWLNNAAKWGNKGNVAQVNHFPGVKKMVERESSPPISEEQRQANIIKLRDLIAGIGKGIR